MRELKAVSKHYRYEDESGYSFDVHAVYDPELGWSASVSMEASGRRECDAAVRHLRHACERFLRMLDEQASETPSGEE